MKHTLLSLMVAAMPTMAMAQAIDTAPEGYKLVWSDEFDGTALDEKVWSIEVNGNGGGNQELQYYRRENVSVKDGNLVLTARRENFSGKSFTSGRINSREKAAFKHGFLQARIKMPKIANGLWPAYWMMGNDYSKVGWPRCGEMDIIEMGHFNGINNGTQDSYFNGTLHFGPSASATDHQQISQDNTADHPVCDGEYHIFTVEWDDNTLSMYYDLDGFTAAKKRRARYFTTDITANNENFSAGKYFQKEFFFIFNLAVGGIFPNIYNAAGITALPNAGDEASMLVDWVRVYQDENDANRIYITPDGSNVETGGNGGGGETLEEDFDTELGRFGSKALDENGKTTFDFDKASDAILIGTSYGVTEALNGKILADYNVDDTRNYLWVWENTYMANASSGVNSFGFEEGYNSYTVSGGWSGLGYASNAGSGKDMTVLTDDHILHFAMRGVDPDEHASHQIGVGDAAFSLGQSPRDGNPVLGDFKRDGSWTNFDIPVKVLKELNGGDNLFGATASNYAGNVFCVLSGGVYGTPLQFDNVFFYKNANVSTDTPITDTKTELGQYGTKSVVDGQPTFDFTNATDVVLIGTSGGVTEAFRDVTVADYNVDNVNNFFYIWNGGDYVAMPSEGANSFGWDEEHTRLAVGNGTWNGAGYASTGKGKDLTMIDNTYYLHFALKGTDALLHASQTFTVGKAKFVIGSTPDGNVILGDYKRDGEWYSFDIPVARLQQLGGTTLFADASNYLDNVFAFTTTNVKGNEINVDNIFFYKKVSDGGAPVELPSYITPALDAEGVSTFDLSDVRNAVLIGSSFGVTEALKEHTFADYSVDDTKNFLYIWDGTYQAQESTGVNSFGWEEGYVSQKVGNAGWSGLGYASSAGNGKNLSMLDNSYYLHFAMKSTDNAVHRIGIGDAAFAVGAEGFNDNGKVTPSIGEFPRDGKWYNFDIPFSEISARAAVVFTGAGAYTGNVFSVLSGGTPGVQLNFDNVFFYQKASEGYEDKVVGIDTVLAPAADSSVIYNIAGQRVAPNARGLVVKGGRKQLSL